MLLLRAQDEAQTSELEVEELTAWLLPRVRAFLARRLLPTEDLDDAVQEALVATLAALPSYRGASSLLSFALGVAWRTTFSRRRSARRQRAVHERLVMLNDAPATRPSRDPRDECITLEQRRALTKLLQRLPEIQQQALVLHYLEGYTVTEMVQTLNAPFDTLQSRLRTARKQLSQAIGADTEALELLRFP